MSIKFPRSPIKITSILSIENTETGDETLTEINPVRNGKSGIYEIRNLMTGQFYIGQSRDLEKRRWRHFNDLRTEKHFGEMQNDWAEYRDTCPILHEPKPEDLFEFRVIVFCRPSELTFYENILIKYLNPYYNTHKQEALIFEEERNYEEI